MRVFVYLLALQGVVNGLFITSPNLSTAWNLSAPSQSITWISARHDSPDVDIYALWWNGPSKVLLSTESGGNSTNNSTDPQQNSLRIASGVLTGGNIWSGTVPASLPANTFMTIQFVQKGRGACLNVQNCAQFIQNVSPEFITFNNKSAVTSLPNGGIRTTIPTPTPSSSASSSASASTTRSAASQTIMPSSTVTASPAPDPPSSHTALIAGVAAGVGGLLVGCAIGALALFFMGRRKKPRSTSFLGPTDIAVREGNAETNLLSPFRPEHRTGPSPEMRGRWAGGTRYEPLSPEDANPTDVRRVATLEFQPRAGLGISTS